MIMKNGQIKVADFGIARLPDKDSFAMEDRSIGTVHYISPEQARGNSVDARSDLYSLAIVLYEMLTGTRPFEAPSSSDVIMMQVTDTPTRPSEINPEISKELDLIIMRALSKRPENRYESALDMLRALERVTLGERVEEEKPKKKSFLSFLKVEKKPEEEPKKKSEARSPDEILSAEPEKLSFGESYEQFDELDDAEEDCIFTEPFETEIVNEALRREPAFEEQTVAETVMEETNGEGVIAIDSTAIFEGADNSEKNTSLVPIESRFLEKYKNKPKYRLITVAALAVLVSLTLVFAAILIYNGSKRYEVPLYASEAAIGNDGIFSVQVEKREHSLVYPKGAVISQSIPAGEMMKKGSEILLTISEGPITLHFQAEEGADAEFLLDGFSSQIKEGGYKITVVEKYEYSQTLEAGKCFAIDEDVLDGTVLTVRISAGSEKTYVEIPDLVGMPIKEAIEFLNESKIVFDIVYGGENNADTVTAQSIEAGKRTEAYVEDGKISLTVGKR
jgi:beta-lactam-binding protein with PASTA domain